MRSRAIPSRSASAALRSPDSTSASRMTPAASLGSGRAAFSSMSPASRSWSRLPQLTPMRTGRSYLSATSIMVWNCRSRFSRKPTLPGLMRYLASASAQAGWSLSRRWPL